MTTMTKHALIIEDNTPNQQVLANLLQKQNVSSTILSNPLYLGETLESLGVIDIIFLDLEMPDVNGYEALTLLQGSPHTRDIPVVAYTVHLSEIQNAYQVGFHSFLPKPIDPKRFPEQLHQIFDGHRIWDQV